MECFLGTNEAANVGILAAEWYCPRETLQLVMEWRAGSLSSFWA